MDAARSACQSSHSSCRNVSSYYRSGYVCQCQGGYQGNPYIADGCQDIDECALPGNTVHASASTAPNQISIDPLFRLHHSFLTKP